MRNVCQQTILMKYHALFVIFEKKNGKLLIINYSTIVVFEKKRQNL